MRQHLSRLSEVHRRRAAELLRRLHALKLDARLLASKIEQARTAAKADEATKPANVSAINGGNKLYAARE
jgi:hypothetical protein